MTKTPEPDQFFSADVLARAVPVREWLLHTAKGIPDPNVLTDGFAQRLRAAGLPLDRMSSAMPTLHSQRRGFGRQWRLGEPVKELVFKWENFTHYTSSPYYEAHESGEWVIFRLDETPDDRFSIVPELRAEGISHYICVPVFFTDGNRAGMTFSTKDPAGFSDDDIAVLRFVEPTFAAIMELRGARMMLDDLLRIYVGDEPHRRILSGEVRRGEVLPIQSAIIFADMVGFTALSSAMNAEQTTELLNRYYDCIVPAVEAVGGEVLKYIGDGVLAIVRVDEEAGPGSGCEAEACARALDAARHALKAVDEATRDADTPIPFTVKLALHVGEVAYGNVGSGARLDFTVIGHSVNLASRIADLSGKLKRPLLVSEDFRKRLPDRAFTPLGEHALKGVGEPQTVYEPA